MNDADLVAAAHAAFNPYVLEQLSSRIGLPPDAIQQVVNRASPGIVLMLMARAGSADGVQRIFGVIMSDEANARIEAQLAGLTASSHGLKTVELAGHALATRIADSREIAMISDHIAALTTVPPQATHALTDVASAVVFGVIKHHVLLEQGSPGDLPGLLAYQWPMTAPWLAEGYAKAFGFENSAAFADNVPQRLAQLASALPHARATPPDEPAPPGPPPSSASFGAQASGPAGAPAQLLTMAEPVVPAPRRRYTWVWAIGVVVVLLVGIIVYGYQQRPVTDDDRATAASSATSGTLSAAPPASGAAAQAAADSGVSGTAGASGVAASSETASATGAALGGSPASDAKPASAASQ